MSKFDSPEPAPNHLFSRASYFDRAGNRTTHKEKEALADFVADNLVTPDERIFLSTGSTVCLAGERILTRIKGANILTNSVPLATRFMELSQSRALAPLASVDLMGGPVNADTGMVGSMSYEKTRCTKAFMSPHGIDRTGMVGNRDVAFLKKAMGAHREVILLVTWEKLFHQGNEHLKKPGHIAKEIRNGRVYRLVIAGTPPKYISSKSHTACEDLLYWLKEEIGVVIDRAP